MQIKYLIIVLVILTIIGCTAIFKFLNTDISYCKTVIPVSFNNKRSPVINPASIQSGYTLLTPINTNENPVNTKSTVYLIDMYGHPVHEWKLSDNAFFSYLNPDGNLFVEAVSPGKKSIPSGGDTGIIKELNWDGETIWEYKNPWLHHDFDILPNGNIAVLVWEKIDSHLATRIKGGFSNSTIGPEMFSDAILELNRKNETVWQWHASQNLDPAIDYINPGSPRSEWTHANSIKYLDKNPITQTPAYLVSFRNIDTVVMIDKAQGKIIWRSPKKMLGGQHDATYLANGNILIFDNGVPGKIPPSPGSRVVEINPQKNKVVWEYEGGKSNFQKAQFYSSIVGGAQRLQNGNTLITDGLMGRIFEVTSDKKIVWDITNPFGEDTYGNFWPFNPVFKARRYTFSEINWPSKIHEPLPLKGINCYK